MSLAEASETSGASEAWGGSVEDFLAILNRSGTKLNKVVLWAIKRRRNDVLELVVDHAANLEKCDSRGFTPLSRAVITGDSKAVKMLLEAGADPEGEDDCGMTPLQYARQCRRRKIASMIRQYLKKTEGSDSEQMAEEKDAALNETGTD